MSNTGVTVGDLSEIYPIKSAHIIKEGGRLIFEHYSKFLQPPGIFDSNRLSLVNNNICVLIIVIEPGNDLRMFKRHRTI